MYLVTFILLVFPISLKCQIYANLSEIITKHASCGRYFCLIENIKRDEVLFNSNLLHTSAYVGTVIHTDKLRIGSVDVTTAIVFLII
jgi:hypothetical protein